MDAAQPNPTAMIVALHRDEHRSSDEPPWILDDPYALDLVGPAWRDIRAACRALLREPLRRQVRASVVARSRYAEDRLAAEPYSQYVILGAGLDSFAWRRADLVGAVRVFEVDHPVTQTWKRARIDELDLPVRDGHVFAPVDFETGTLRGGLDRAGLDWSQPTFFSWLGVTVYLTTEAIEATLRTVAACGPRSAIVLSYDARASFLDDAGRELVQAESNLLASVNQRYTTKFSPTDAEALIARGGLEVSEHPTPDVISARYFSDRSDGLRPSTVERLVAARVPG